MKNSYNLILYFTRVLLVFTYFMSVEVNEIAAIYYSRLNGRNERADNASHSYILLNFFDLSDLYLLPDPADKPNSGGIDIF